MHRVPVRGVFPNTPLLPLEVLFAGGSFGLATYAFVLNEPPTRILGFFFAVTFLFVVAVSFVTGVWDRGDRLTVVYGISIATVSKEEVVDIDYREALRTAFRPTISLILSDGTDILIPGGEFRCASQDHAAIRLLTSVIGANLLTKGTGEQAG